jgi:ribose-phosphate pyrophosphokinase
MKILFSTTNYEYLKQNLLKIQAQSDIDEAETPGTNLSKVTVEAGVIEVKKFPDGETYHRVLTSVTDKDVVIVGGTYTDSETFELYDIACHCSKAGVSSLTMIIPYYGYATMERAVKEGEIVKAKTRARILSSIPGTPKTRVVFMDLHSEGTPHYLEGSIQPVHLYAKKLIIEMCQKISIGTDPVWWKNKDFVLGSTDAGRAKWVESLANEMGVECAIITKRRTSGSDTSIVGINADVKGKKVVIYDDMIRTGGSLLSAGKAYKDAGASHVYAVASHGVLPDQSIFKLFGNPPDAIFDKVYVTNTHPQAHKLSQIEFAEIFKTFAVFDVSPMLFEYLRE